MSNREKVAWLQALVSIWGWGWFVLLVPAVLPGPALDDGWTGFVRGLLTMVGGLTGVYLLILSWRAAYISGRNR